MRKAKLIKLFREIGSSGNGSFFDLCRFEKTIEISDIPPIGYDVEFSEPDKTLHSFSVEVGVVKNESGDLTLYGKQEILHRHNTNYDRCIGVIRRMANNGWKVDILHKDLKDHKDLIEV